MKLSEITILTKITIISSSFSVQFFRPVRKKLDKTGFMQFCFHFVRKKQILEKKKPDLEHSLTRFP